MTQNHAHLSAKIVYCFGFPLRTFARFAFMLFFSQKA